MEKVGTVSPFHYRQYRWLFASNLAFFFAMGSQGVVRAWLAFKLTNSELALGMVMFAVSVPMFFMAPLGGVIADRVDRRKVIIVGQSIIIFSELVIAVLILTDHLQFWHLLTMAGLMGCAFPFIMPARQAIVVNVVGKQALGSAMGINMAAFNTARVLGPASAGFLIDIIGVSHSYWLGVILFVAALLCLFQLEKSLPMAGAKDLSVMKSVVEGMVYMKNNRLVLILLLFGLIPIFLAMPFQNLLVVFAEKIWNVGSRGLGILSAAVGAGGIFGSIWVASLGNAQKRLKRMMVSMVLFGSLLFCFALSPYFYLGLGLVLVASIFSNVFAILNNTAVQLVIPDNVRGRISSFLMMSFSLPMIGTLPVAALAEIYGAPLAVALVSLLAIIIALLFYLLSPDLKRMDLSISEAIHND